MIKMGLSATWYGTKAAGYITEASGILAIAAGTATGTPGIAALGAGVYILGRIGSDILSSHEEDFRTESPLELKVDSPEE